MTACRVCAKEFEPRLPLQAVCSVPCARRIPSINRKAERQRTKERKEAIKRRADWQNEAQRACNAYIRARDALRPCICCGKPFEPDKPGGAVDAGHYLSVGSAPNLRFDEFNIHAQRKNCNRPGGTTRAAFRAGMIARIGLAEVERLEADQQPRKFTVEELKAIKADYKARLAALERTVG